MVKKTAGGKREGAGRPTVKNRRVTLSVKILPEIKAWLALQEKSAGQTIENAIMDKMKDDFNVRFEK